MNIYHIEMDQDGALVEAVVSAKNVSSAKAMMGEHEYLTVEEVTHIGECVYNYEKVWAMESL